MQHPNESMLQELYARFGQGDMPGFLAGCADRVTFSVPGEAAVSGEFTKATFMDLIGRVMERSGGTFREDVLGVFANDQHGVLLLHHQFDATASAGRIGPPASSSLWTGRSLPGASIRGVNRNLRTRGAPASSVPAAWPQAAP